MTVMCLIYIYTRRQGKMSCIMTTTSADTVGTMTTLGVQCRWQNEPNHQPHHVPTLNPTINSIMYPFIHALYGRQMPKLQTTSMTSS